jgi:FlaA1/EpsC-like NDP-sugar epimerase
MYEELFKDSEEFAGTDHPKILRATRATENNPDFYILLNKLQEVAQAHNNEDIPSMISKMLPEFKHAPNKITNKLIKIN